MMRAHSSPWEGKRCACDGASQVVIGITVSAGKMRTGEAEDGLNLNSGLALREQVSGDPKIYDAPVRLRKALQNMPSLHTTLVDRGGLFGAGGARLCGGQVATEGRGGWWWCTVPEGLQQRLAARRQTRTGVNEFHPRSIPIPVPSCGLLKPASRPKWRQSVLAQSPPYRCAKCLPAAVATAGSRGEVLRRIQACRWPGLVCNTTQGSCPLARMTSTAVGSARSRSTRI